MGPRSAATVSPAAPSHHRSGHATSVPGGLKSASPPPSLDSFARRPYYATTIRPTRALATAVMNVHHIGVLVSDLTAGRRLIETFLGGRALGPPVDDPLQQATVQFFDSGGARLELIVPLGPDSHLHNVLARQGESLVHLCYETPDLDGAVSRMRGQGALLISRRPAVAFGGREVAFLFLPNRMIVELLQA
jgi:catechol 2,3-dioxygenase-like lactoylglutathione lyase family enzyme